MNSLTRDLLWTLSFVGVLFALVLWRHYAGDAHALAFGRLFLPLAGIWLFKEAREDSYRRETQEEEEYDEDTF